jgi:diguanylate cyclase (GGDEF)-like protein
MNVFACYDAILMFSCASLLVLMVLIFENGRMKPETKKRLYFTYWMLILAMLMERLAVLLNGAPEWTRGLHSAIKCLDYILTPLVGMMFVRQISREGRCVVFVRGVLAVNTVLQLVSYFTGWTYYLDEKNVYHHGPLYFLYILIYISIILFVAYQFYEYGQRFKKRNRFSLYLIVVLTNAGIAAQELFDLRLSYLSLTMGSILLFIHNNEFNQQEKDEMVLQQQALITTDTLTGLKSRYAYSQKLNELDQLDALPEDTIVFMIDINGLKSVNDSLGHQAGDELITSMASSILEIFSPYGECYRTGGDEFVAILRTDASVIPVLCGLMNQKVECLAGDNGASGLSYGYASALEYPECSIEKLVSIADQRMYLQKASYYSTSGRERRRQ